LFVFDSFQGDLHEAVVPQKKVSWICTRYNLDMILPSPPHTG
jgi:hypothetical protein